MALDEAVTSCDYSDVRIRLLVAAAALTLTSCSATQPIPTPSATEDPGQPPTTADVAAAIAGVAEGSLVTIITEENDPNDLIGRPNGYVDGAVIQIPGFPCEELAVTCGATLEVWPTDSDAKQRSEYIQGVLDSAPLLGVEYNYLSGNYLLRVSGDVVPSRAVLYESALADATG